MHCVLINDYVQLHFDKRYQEEVNIMNQFALLSNEEMMEIDGGWYVKLLWGLIEFGSSHN